MKVTPKTDDVHTTLYNYSMTVSIDYRPGSYDPVARVIEFPKVWREDGKQYKVYSCSYYHNGNFDDHVTIRVPYGVNVCGFSCDETIERY